MDDVLRDWYSNKTIWIWNVLRDYFFNAFWQMYNINCKIILNYFTI